MQMNKIFQAGVFIYLTNCNECLRSKKKKGGGILNPRYDSVM